MRENVTPIPYFYFDKYVIYIGKLIYVPIF